MEWRGLDTTDDPYENLADAIDDLAHAIAETKPMNYIVDLLPDWTKDNGVNLLMIEFTISAMFAVIMADISLCVLAKI